MGEVIKMFGECGRHVNGCGEGEGDGEGIGIDMGEGGLSKDRDSS